MLPAGLAPKMLSTEGACEYLGGISPDTLAVLRKRGWIRPVLKTRYLVSELDALVEKLARERDLVAALARKDTDDDGELEDGREVGAQGEDRPGPEGEGHGLRVVPGGRDRRRKRKGGEGDRGSEDGAYPDLPGVG